MFEATPESALSYLRGKAWISANEPVTVSELKGGVSSMVLKIVTPEKRWVLKQALPKLRVELEWLSSVKRIDREQDCLVYLSQVLQPGLVPEIIHRDPENHLYVMTCAADDAENWRDLLLGGHPDATIAASAGSILGRIHNISHADEAAARQFGDKKFFHELRLDPFYGQIAEKHPTLADAVGAYAATLATSSICFVHGDFSPKNILVANGRLLLLDFEVGHFGHPAFDMGFFLTHLTLKVIKFWDRKEDYLPLLFSFWNAYISTAGFETSTWHERSCLPHLGCNLLARINGKSPVPYLTNEEDRARVRAMAFSLIRQEVPTMRVFFDLLHRAN